MSPYLWIDLEKSESDWHGVCVPQDCGSLLSEGDNQGCYPLDGHVLCKNCNTSRIQALTAKATTDLWASRRLLPSTVMTQRSLSVFPRFPSSSSFSQNKAGVPQPYFPARNTHTNIRRCPLSLAHMHVWTDITGLKWEALTLEAFRQDESSAWSTGLITYLYH